VIGLELQLDESIFSEQPIFTLSSDEVKDSFNAILVLVARSRGFAQEKVSIELMGLCNNVTSELLQVVIPSATGSANLTPLGIFSAVFFQIRSADPMSKLFEISLEI
jgi:hypothetical protein